MEPMIGRQLGQYTLTRHLAHGGMSEVYLAYKETRSQVYALKMVEQTNPAYACHFQHEVQALQKVRHPHILPVLDTGAMDGFAYYVMPYMACGSLRERLRHGPLSVQEAEPILTQVGQALQFLHNAGLVHRDLKPANILLDEAGHAWLADFGLARALEAEQDMTEPEILIGTPSYMAPELAEESASPRSDIYALGVVLYEMLTAHCPFTGATALEICWKHRTHQPPLPSRFTPSLAPAVEEVIMRALAKRPEARFATAGDLIEAYHRALAGSVRLPRPGRAHRRQLAAALTLLALLVILGTDGLVSGQQHPPAVSAHMSVGAYRAPADTIRMAAAFPAPGTGPAGGTTHSGAMSGPAAPLHAGHAPGSHGHKQHRHSPGGKHHGRRKPKRA